MRTLLEKAYLTAVEPILPPAELFDEWHRRFYQLKRAHYRAAWWYEKRNRFMGRLTIVLAALVAPGALVLTMVERDGQFYLPALAALVGALAGILASLQVYDRDSERAERHRVAGNTYAKLEGDVEELGAFMPADGDTLQQRAQGLRNEWHRLTSNAPVVPERIFNAVEREVDQRPRLHLRRAEQRQDEQFDYSQSAAAQEATAAALS